VFFRELRGDIRFLKERADAKGKLAIAGDYDAIAVRSSTTLKGALLEASKRVKVIGRAGIGVDNVDIEG